MLSAYGVRISTSSNKRLSPCFRWTFIQAKIDLVVDKALDLIFRPVALVGEVGGRMTKNQQLASGGAAAVVGGGVSITLMAVAVPVVFMAVLFLPLTLMGGVSGVAHVFLRFLLVSAVSRFFFFFFSFFVSVLSFLVV